MAEVIHGLVHRLMHKLSTAGAGQYTHGTPNGAFGETLTTPAGGEDAGAAGCVAPAPVAPGVPALVAPPELPAAGVAGDARPAGTSVTPEPVSTSTWPAGMDASAVAFAPISVAIFTAFADAPAP